jgi:hypothetical protein
MLGPTPIRDRPIVAATLLVAVNHSALEDAAFSGGIEDERARLLAIADQVRSLVAGWAPVTPQDDEDILREFGPRDDEE